MSTQLSRRGLLRGTAAVSSVAAVPTALAMPAVAADRPRTTLKVTGTSPLDKETYRLAAVQAEPVWFNLDATIDKTIALMAEAKAGGADVVGFPELWLPGYPAFMWVGDEAYKAPLKDLYLENALTLGSEQHHRLEQASANLGITVVTGLGERVGDSTMYMSTWTIDHGRTVHTQRKIKPSGQEWNIFHSGFADGYAVVETTVGRLGALSCNENRRPLVRDLYYTAGEQLHVAAWPVFAFNLGIYGMSAQCSMESSAQYAGEGGVTTIAPTQVLSQAYFDRFPLPAGADGLITAGGGSAAIFGSDAAVLTQYLDPRAEGIVYADVASAVILAQHNRTYDSEPFDAPASGLRP